MTAVHLVAVFCAPVITGVRSVMGRLVCARTVRWVHTVIAVSCVPIMFRDRSAIAVNLDTGGCQTTAVEVRLWALKSSLPSTHTPSRQAEFRIWLVELINGLVGLDYESRNWLVTWRQSLMFRFDFNHYSGFHSLPQIIPVDVKRTSVFRGFYIHGPFPFGVVEIFPWKLHRRVTWYVLVQSQTVHFFSGPSPEL